MSSILTILTHPGGAHKDELLACSVMLALHPVRLVRREPTPADLADASTCVIDVGHVHDPALNNFDHHQFPKDHPPTCALSLILQHLGLYNDARDFLEWLEPAEWFDCRGPFATAAWLGVERDILNKLNSPIDATLLKRFAASNQLEPGQPLWEVLRMVGEDIVDYVKGLRDRLAVLERHAEFWTIEQDGRAMEILFLPRMEPALDEPSMGMDRFIERRGKVGNVAALVYPDRRGDGFGLSRFRDDERVDFTRVARESDVHFAHARGFVAKTSATQIPRLKELLQRAASTSSR